MKPHRQTAKKQAKKVSGTFSKKICHPAPFAVRKRFLTPFSFSVPSLRGPAARRGFTLFELILAIALSATLLTLIGTAINLYLMRVDASRTRVEEVQLARSILTMIADDIRAATIYKPQDTSTIAQLMASSTSQGNNGRSGGTGGSGSTNASGATTGMSSSESSSSGGDSSSASSSTSGGSQEADGTLPLGLNGSLAELYVDVTRLPPREELFGTITGYTNAPMPLPAGGVANGGTGTAAAGVVPPSDLKTVRYFVRQGDQLDLTGTAATSLAPGLQQQAGGLVRQVIPRPMFRFAEQTGDSALLDSGQTLLAPEVVHLEFRYYDGQQVTDVWDMQEEKSLPLAIEVRIWLTSPDLAQSAAGSRFDLTSATGNVREYRQTVCLPMAQLSGSDAVAATGQSSSSSSSFGSSSASGSSGSGSSSSSGFGQP